ncbi:threonine synthase [candidate division KSB1 bacterium]|nr:threonine synthase [candidate division KSB1 bacterium]
MPHQNRLLCPETGESYSPDEPRWCSDSGGLLQLSFKPELDISRLAHRKETLWRYRNALPIDRDENIISFDEGFTPLLPISIAGRTVYVKQDHLFPTGSFKDRGAAVLISKAKELGIKRVVQDSSGNAGCAIAAYCARAGISCDIYVPQSTSPAKLAQIRGYGAALHRVLGSRQDAADAALEAAQKHYYASHCYNPYFHHGVKTVAYEICEQLGWRAPDAVVLPVGNGSLFLGAFIGFTELYQMGLIEKMPNLIGVQSRACAPLVTAFEQRSKDLSSVVVGETIAEGIAISAPIRGREILQAVRETNGKMLAVEEEVIRKAQIEMGRCGFYIEATAAVAVAGVEAYTRDANRHERLVTVFTGHGLKGT